MSDGVEIQQEGAIAEPEIKGSGNLLGIDFNAVYASPAFWPGLITFFGFLAMFWSMMKFLPDMWMSEDGYYSHGFLVLPISCYIVFKNWDKFKGRAIQPQSWAAILILAMLPIIYASARTSNYTISAVAMLITLFVSTLFIAGFQWLKALFWPIAYLGFGLPLFQSVIEIWTNPLQLMSTKVAFQLLNLMQFSPHLDNDQSTIYLGSFVLNIAVPCSGLKLMLALGAFSMFFMLVANLRIWANIVMVLMWVPLALFINGLRIALIGVVGNTWGHDAGMSFHDYSGYITLILCFFILFRVARGLGWKD
jgi:exosortase